MKIKQEQYLEWLDNPVTEVFRQYLRDVSDESRKFQSPDRVCRSLDDLIGLGADITEATIQRGVLDDLAELTFEDIEEFYTKEEEDSAAS